MPLKMLPYFIGLKCVLLLELNFSLFSFLLCIPSTVIFLNFQSLTQLPEAVPPWNGRSWIDPAPYSPQPHETNAVVPTDADHKGRKRAVSVQFISSLGIDGRVCCDRGLLFFLTCCIPYEFGITCVFIVRSLSRSQRVKLHV